MLQEKGVVIALNGEFAVIQTQNKLACASCKASQSCGNGIVERYLSAKLFETELVNQINARVGQSVLIEIPKASVTKASIVVYCLPLLFLFFGAALGSIAQLNENTTIFLSLLSLTVGLLVTKYYNHRWLTNELYLPKIVSVVN